jgi:hypothetical protein
MVFRDVNNYGVFDQFPGIPIDAIPLLSDKLYSLYARAIEQEHLKNSLTKFLGLIEMTRELEYHFDNFQQLARTAKPYRWLQRKAMERTDRVHVDRRRSQPVHRKSHL